MQFSFTPKVKHDKGQLIVSFKHVVENELLKLDSANYKNELGQSFTISKFKYYIGQIHLKNSKGKDFIFKDYFLINEDEELSKQIKLNNIPNGNYKSISFILGVDSARNTSGAQVGALDPALGMFWSWNQGYIFLMMEGTSPSSTTFNNSIIFHLGGFTPPYNCIRKINPTFGAKELVVSGGNTSKMGIKTDMLKMFIGRSPVKFGVTNLAMEGAIATTIADNCVDMFSVTSIEN